MAAISLETSVSKEYDNSCEEVNREISTLLPGNNGSKINEKG
jgi:hypothetical protein